MLAALKGQASPTGVVKPRDTGDDSVLPPDPGYMGATSPYMEVTNKNQMPFPTNHDPRMDFVNRWPSQLPPSGILNDLKPNLDPGLPMVRKLPGG